MLKRIVCWLAKWFQKNNKKRNCSWVHHNPLEFQHHYRCYNCNHVGFIEFDLQGTQINWIECHACGKINEIPSGNYADVTVIEGHWTDRKF